MPITRAFAKLNLSLEILGRRPDGFHDLVSVMQTISLADTVTVEPDSRMQFTCNVPNLRSPSNLAYRAATLVRDRYQLAEGCSIELGKRIPVAAGLGGGSSDAAATLVAVARLWEVPGSCDSLAALAAELGSDVPFFLTGGAALVEGRGERVQALPPIRDNWYLLVKPPVDVATRDVFAALPADEWGDGAATRDMARAIRAGCPVTIGINTLQNALFRLYPAARSCFAAVQAIFPGRAMVSGSGPTVFAVCDSQEQAQEAALALAGRYWTHVAASAIPPGEETPCR